MNEDDYLRGIPLDVLIKFYVFLSRENLIEVRHLRKLVLQQILLATGTKTDGYCE